MQRTKAERDGINSLLVYLLNAILNMRKRHINFAIEDLTDY